jgi:hypothetical protein
MARGDDPDLAVPEADRLEQQEPADHLGGEAEPWDHSSPLSPEASLEGGGTQSGGGVADAADRADEADRLEQAQDVVGDPDEEYARDQE